MPFAVEELVERLTPYVSVEAALPDESDSDLSEVSA